MKTVISILLIIGITIWIAAFIIKKPAVVDTIPSPAPKETLMPSPASKSTLQFTQAEQVTKPGVQYTVTLHTTSGDIALELSNSTQVTTNNFVFLAQKGFYDNVIFHRVIPGFMIQGGDPTGTGTGGPGYRFADEEFTGEYKRGTLAMANAGADTNGSQFFIMHADYQLPANYVIFGQVSKGLEVVDKIASGKTGANDRPLQPVAITSVTIEEQ